MTVKIQMMARSEREAQIHKSLESPIGYMDFYEFRNTKMSLKVIRISTGLPIYRMENFRTFTDQREHIAKEGLDLNYFAHGQEVESVQQVQHDLLARLARKGKADSVIPIIDVLKREKQREPILISASGIVINGNRRLAGMRELYAEDPASFPEFTHVNCMVLPDDALADEIVDIEASLQAKPETKLDYDWIGDGMLINELIKRGRTPAEVADKLNRSEKEIKNSLQALFEADLYLKDWAQKEGQYSLIREDAEQFFKDLPKQLNGKTQNLENASRVIAWSLYDNRDKLPGRIYDFNAAFGRLATDVLDRTATELEISTELEDTEGDFDLDIDEDDELTYEALLNTFRDDEKKEEAVEALISACQAAIETEKGQKSGAAALKALTQVHSKLVAIDLSKADPKTYAGIEKQLHAILGLAQKLSEKVSEIKGS